MTLTLMCAAGSQFRQRCELFLLPFSETRPAPVKWTSQRAAMAAVVVGSKMGFGLAPPVWKWFDTGLTTQSRETTGIRLGREVTLESMGPLEELRSHLFHWGCEKPKAVCSECWLNKMRGSKTFIIRPNMLRQVWESGSAYGLFTSVLRKRRVESRNQLVFPSEFN